MKTTEEYGLIGFPLGHSFSKDFFTNKFKINKRDASYTNFEIKDIALLPELIKKHTSLKGLNVTIPHKCDIIPFIDDFSTQAKAIGAVNCIRIIRNANDSVKLEGHNTDCIGFTESLINFLCGTSIGCALILGSGGASKAVSYSLSMLHIDYKIVSRQPKNQGEISYEEANTLIPISQLIVNCTPLGMWPVVDICPDIDYSQIDDRHFLFDLVYNPQETEFMKQGKARGAQVKNGLEMLESQAEAALKIWNS